MAKGRSTVPSMGIGPQFTTKAPKSTKFNSLMHTYCTMLAVEKLLENCCCPGKDFFFLLVWALDRYALLSATVFHRTSSGIFSLCSLSSILAGPGLESCMVYTRMDCILVYAWNWTPMDFGFPTPPPSM